MYGHYKYFHSYCVRTDFKRQNLTSTDVRFWRLKSIPALEGLTVPSPNLLLMLVVLLTHLFYTYDMLLIVVVPKQ